jgi:L-alanine-DL-glutamate epimerase-like enolase superfamily enzyme
VTPTTVQSIAHRVLDIELDQPFTIAGGTQQSARIVLVEVTLADGTVGLGEAAPLAAYNGETVEQVVSALDHGRNALVGIDVARWRRAALTAKETLGGCGAARCAVETALLDALCRHRDCSLYDWFGARDMPSLEIDVTIPIGSVENAERAARSWAERGFEVFKIKVGAPGDLERVLAVQRAVPGARLILDANAGLDAERAMRLVHDVRAQGGVITLFEQPVPRGDWVGLAQVMSTGTRVALDESVCTAADALEAVGRLGSGIVLNIKLMKAGIIEALDVAAVARASGAALMIGGMVESSLAMTTSACFAAGLGGFEFADLDTHLFLQNSPFEGGLRMEGPRLDVSAVGLGHGVSLARRS